MSCDARRVAGQRALGDVLRGQLLAAAAAPRRASARNGEPPAATSARASRASDDAARRYASTWPIPPQPQRGPSSVDRHVAELAGEAVRAVEELAAGDDRAADAGRDGQVDEVVDAARRAEGLLAERGDVRVAIEERRQARALARAPRRAGCRGTAGRGWAARRRRRSAGRPGRATRSPMPGDARRPRPARRRRGRASRPSTQQPRRRPRDPRSSGVGRSMRASRVPSGRTTAARIRVPPRSTAMTGREDRAKPLVSIVETRLEF